MRCVLPYVLRLFSITIFAAMTSGCGLIIGAPYEEAVLANGTGQPIVTAWGNGPQTILPGAVGRIKYPMGHTVEPEPFTVTTQSGQVWQYPEPPVSTLWEEFMEGPSLRWRARVFGFQLQPDGRLYMVKPSKKLPLKDLPPQPPGYPIAPKRIDGSAP